MTKDSSTVSVRLKNDDIKRLKASGCTASQVFRQFLDRGFTPAEPEVDLTAFLRACERRRRKPQEVIDMITEQILEV